MNTERPNTPFPQHGRERREALEESRKRSLNLAEREKAGTAKYETYDAPLNMRDGGLEKVSSFEATFIRLIPLEKGGLTGFIERRLESRRGGVVAFEIGGPASQAMRDFSPGFLKKSAGVALVDQRDEEQRGIDASHNHTVIAGDILSGDTDKKVQEWFGEDRADVMFQRMYAGWQSMPRDPNIIAGELQKYYALLGEGGLFFGQVPRELSVFVRPWVNLLQREYPGYQAKFESGNHAYYDAVFFTKYTGAPQKLPMLDIPTVKGISARGSTAGYWEIK